MRAFGLTSGVGGGPGLAANSLPLDCQLKNHIFDTLCRILHASYFEASGYSGLAGEVVFFALQSRNIKMLLEVLDQGHTVCPYPLLSRES